MRHLGMVAAIAQTGNLTRAAERLGLTPSALSHRLAEAERRLGVTLFLRMGRKVDLTPAGQTILRAAEQALAQVAQAESDVERLHGIGQEGALSLTVGHYALFDWLPAFLVRLREAGGGVELCARPDGHRDPILALTEGSVDLALLPYAPRADDLFATALFKDELWLACASDDPLARRASAEAADLQGRDFLTYTRVVVPDQEYERFMRPAKTQVGRWTDMEDVRAIVGMVGLGLGVSILSGWAMDQIDPLRKLVRLRLGADGLPIVWHVAHRRALAADPRIRVVVAALHLHFSAWERNLSGEASQPFDNT